MFPNAFALDLFGCDVYTFPPGATGAISFHDPFEGTEILILMFRKEHCDTYE